MALLGEQLDSTLLLAALLLFLLSRVPSAQTTQPYIERSSLREVAKIAETHGIICPDSVL